MQNIVLLKCDMDISLFIYTHLLTHLKNTSLIHNTHITGTEYSTVQRGQFWQWG